ncbi:MAG: hypothetical protein U5Q44_14960 [Dehalococcoidia bacterium]|nr:hypothetical protein [Dehalococcoidia bacterium]
MRLPGADLRRAGRGLRPGRSPYDPNAGELTAEASNQTPSSEHWLGAVPAPGSLDMLLARRRRPRTTPLFTAALVVITGGIFSSVLRSSACSPGCKGGRGR